MFWRTWLDESPTKKRDESWETLNAYLGIRTRIFGLQPVAVFIGREFDACGGYYMTYDKMTEKEAKRSLELLPEHLQTVGSIKEQSASPYLTKAKIAARQFDILKN